MGVGVALSFLDLELRILSGTDVVWLQTVETKGGIMEFLLVL